jgi:4-hydroxy-tetrahydrodipicolinate synthase
MEDATMTKLHKPHLVRGIYVASLTPMHEDLSCNCEALAAHCNDLIHKGCKGVVLFGTTGEGPSLSVPERIQILQEIIRLGIDPQKIIVSISCCAIDDTVTLASVAIDQQCAAILICPPFFYKNVADEGVINFYTQVIRSINHPELKMLLYHIPQYSGVSISINALRTLKNSFPHTIVGIKESEGNLAFIKEILSTGDIELFVGNELLISEAIRLGAAGGISGIANAYPELICSLYEFGKDPKAPDHNTTAHSILESLKNYPLFPAIKNLVEKQKGKEWHTMRPPLVPLHINIRTL